MKKLLIATAALAIVLFSAWVGTAAASGGTHWCRQGDPPIFATKWTSCSFAGAVVTKYANRYPTQPKQVYFGVRSKTHKLYRVGCRRDGAPNTTGTITCWGPRGTRIWMKFSASI